MGDISSAEKGLNQPSSSTEVRRSNSELKSWNDVHALARDIKERTSGHEAEPNFRQQKKIVDYFSTEDGRKNFPDNNDSSITEKQRTDVLRKIKESKIGRPQIDNMLSTIGTPLDYDDERGLKIQVAFQYLKDLNQNNEQGLKIIAHFSGKGMKNANQVTAPDIIDFYSRYPLPSVFEEDNAQDFLNGIEKVNGDNGPLKKAEYQKSMTLMMRMVYGKKMEYWEQFKLMRGGALRSTIDQQQVSHANSSPDLERTKDGLNKLPEGMEVKDYFDQIRKQNLGKQGYDV